MITIDIASILSLVSLLFGSIAAVAAVVGGTFQQAMAAALSGR